MSHESTRVLTRSFNATHARVAGEPGGWPVLFLHGNCSDSSFWADTLAALPAGLRGIAPDLRGFGASTPEPIDATRGMRDFADDVHRLVDHAEAFERASERKVLIVAHSAGAGVALQYAIDHPGRVGALVLEAPMSPYGFGGTRGPEGAPCWSDFAGSGGGTANPEFVRRLSERDRSGDSPLSPRRVLRECYVKPPFQFTDEEFYLDSLLRMRVGDDHYPGDMTRSENWPGVAPGSRGMNNAIAPKYLRLDAFADVDPRPPVLWVRGADDVIVSDTSLFDFGYLGQLGAVPGWPGADIYPPQPMVAQTRAVLDRYRARGGAYREEVFEGVGHSPHVERPEAFRGLVFPFLLENARAQ
jgi:pimeloyl-ACP methyl ester carboxylesterase